MKSSKRYLLVALVLLLATVFCYSLALADEPITKITITPSATIDLKLKGSPIHYYSVGYNAGDDFVIGWEPATATPVQLKVYLEDVDSSVAELNRGKDVIWTETSSSAYLRSKKEGKVKLHVDALNSEGVYVSATPLKLNLL
jgi:hypothetical protein